MVKAITMLLAAILLLTACLFIPKSKLSYHDEGVSNYGPLLAICDRNPCVGSFIKFWGDGRIYLLTECGEKCGSYEYDLNEILRQGKSNSPALSKIEYIAVLGMPEWPKVGPEYAKQFRVK